MRRRKLVVSLLPALKSLAASTAPPFSRHFFREPLYSNPLHLARSPLHRGASGCVLQSWLRAMQSSPHFCTVILICFPMVAARALVWGSDASRRCPVPMPSKPSTMCGGGGAAAAMAAAAAAASTMGQRNIVQAVWGFKERCSNEVCLTLFFGWHRMAP